MNIEILRKSLFETNSQAASESRELLAKHGIIAINVLGGAGSGKTALLELLIPKLKEHCRVAVLEGDLATTKDAERIAKLGVPTIQLLTDGGCHLTATLVLQGLQRLPLHELDLVFIENVGNPVCPANFDLGENYRISLLSVAEGDDKPAKYPYLYKVAHAIVITKTDLLEHTTFAMSEVRRAFKIIAPEARLFETNRRLQESISHLLVLIVERWLHSCAVTTA